MSKKSERRNKQYIIGAFVGVVVIVISVFLYNFVFVQKKPKISEDQIMIEKGSQTVIVNANGLVEYRSEDGVYTEKWSAEKTNGFFASMRAKARLFLANPVKPSEGAYKVTLYIDGVIVEIYIDEDDEELVEIFEEFENDGGDDGDYFEDSTTPTPIRTITTAPILTVGPGTPTPTPVVTSGGVTQQILPDCDLYGEYVTGRTVISNSICEIVEEIIE